jgi:hypothetical protein
VLRLLVGDLALGERGGEVARVDVGHALLVVQAAAQRDSSLLTTYESKSTITL